MSADHLPNIWQLQAQRDFKGLIDALQNDDRETRKHAASALRVLGAVEALPTLRRLLTSETDEATQKHLRAVIDSLLQEAPEGELPVASRTRQLVARLKSGDPAVIVKAARDLSALKDKTAVEALVVIFHNQQLPGFVRLAAAEALIELESAPTVVTLLAALKSESWQIRRNGVAVLGQLRADWAVARIAERLGDENDYVRRTARAALKRIGSNEAKLALEAHINADPRSRQGLKPDDPEPL
jgi:HEAT repeat protein